MLQSKSKLEEYLSLPEGDPAQLIGGEFWMSPSPTRKHQKIAGIFYRALARFVEENNLGEVYYEFDVKLDDENILRPDIIFVSKDHLKNLEERWLNGSPDIVVEVLSPSTATMDTIVKKEIYEKFNVPEYWIIDPESEEVFVFCKENGLKLVCKGKKCSSKVLEGFTWSIQTSM